MPKNNAEAGSRISEISVNEPQFNPGYNQTESRQENRNGWS
ncbi:hypothetical protein F441_17296 [Phytophthora nicotianae CJ01A1]|uniref:Uncharacterized protein n=4 Tax=Phytophthora nicotianae TaxID=4792 RepID=W2R103_PHYN3|nr:hypothetical protein PPTG_21533 [Phytophthora nicotianae INRA-310]ETL83359.1 hypothetical protein L917_16687 [Phytophthora nicotianae]ETN18185.1 hypothetical protein PPTG_21533 [Phytophthora nicotianae INRA-310]ETO65192.1 hypothetical protein F444_17465 [Phytophthora nicotianae P1976]ETP06295.1 hypothetical protein F441_17296 [Phytophthora nicotianae CJ01A1]